MTLLTLKTERLTLRLIAASDIQFIHKLHSLPEVDEFNTLGIPDNMEETKAIVSKWISDNLLNVCARYTFVIELLDDKKLIGIIGINLGKEKYKNAEVLVQVAPQLLE